MLAAELALLSKLDPAIPARTLGGHRDNSLTGPVDHGGTVGKRTLVIPYSHWTGPTSSGGVAAQETGMTEMLRQRETCTRQNPNGLRRSLTGQRIWNTRLGACSETSC